MLRRGIFLFVAGFLSLCRGQQDVAAFKPSNQSRTLLKYGSYLANDQNEGTCSSTMEMDEEAQNNVYAWWQVDLESAFYVVEIKIKTPTYAYEVQFLSNFTVTVSRESRLNTGSICGAYVNDNPPTNSWIEIRCHTSLLGRFVTILRGNGVRHDVLFLCEVNVIADLFETQPPEEPDTSYYYSPAPPAAPPDFPLNCALRKYLCLDGSCIAPKLLCDGQFDCSSMEDEMNCWNGNSCAPSDFVCMNQQCIDNHLTCDGFPDCSDDSDELPRFCERNSTCTPGYRACKDGTCVASSSFCDRIISCRDRTDESQSICEHSPSNCKLGEFVCDNGGCQPGSSKCNGSYECSDNSDESYDTCGRIPCQSASEFTCSDGSCIGISKKCDGYWDCPSYEDESFCRSCSYNEYLCRLDGVCITQDKVCNGRADCSDYSDEAYCYYSGCKGGTLYCPPLGSCLSPSLVCNKVHDCPGGLDEANCEQVCPEEWTRCPQGPCIPEKRTCDGYLDCQNGEDEDVAMCTKKCTESGYYCVMIGCIPRTSLCDGIADCPSKEDESDDVCSSVGVCRSTSEYKCSGSGRCIPLSWLCDGADDCNDGEDETEDICEKVSCRSDQFVCLSRRNECIAKDLRCDGTKDCLDGSDEIGCVWVGSVAGHEARELLILIRNQPYRICADNIDKAWNSALCKYISITDQPPVSNISHTAGYARLYSGSKFKSIFSLIEAFQKDSTCMLGSLPLLECNVAECGSNGNNKLSPVFPFIGNDGDLAAPGRWPWHALLKAEPDKMCGASYLGDDWYLTSASCVTLKDSTTPLVTRAIKIYTNTSQTVPSHAVSHGVDKLIVHPDYNAITRANDLAMVKTNSSPYNTKPDRICLPDPFLYTVDASSKFKLCYVSGFGLDKKYGFPSPYLLNARFDMMTHKECFEHVSNTSNLQYPVMVDYTLNFCAGIFKSTFGFNICTYDFGDPLVCLKKDLRWVQVGIASRNIGTDCMNSVFARVTTQLGFINDAMISDFFKKS